MARESSTSRRELTADRLDVLLRQLDPDPSTAAERYTLLCRRLAAYFAWQRCLDPEGLADEVLDRVARRLADGERVDNIVSYALGVARNVARESFVRLERERKAEGAFGTGSSPQEATADDAALDCLDHCLGRLPVDRRGQLLAYYGSDVGARIPARRQLATELGVTALALRNRMLRMRQRLEQCVAGCMGSERGRGADATRGEEGEA
ncbi:MAG: hypothetical protein R2745_21795 [Vicinamibacterales bacterium]